MSSNRSVGNNVNGFTSLQVGPATAGKAPPSKGNDTNLFTITYGSGSGDGKNAAGGNDIQPPSNTPLEPVPLDTLKKTMDSGSLLALMMELAKLLQKSHHMNLESSYAESKHMESLNEEGYKLGRESADATNASAKTKSSGEMIGGGFQGGMSGVGLKQARNGQKESSQITAGKKQIRANEQTFDEAQKKFEFEKNRLTKGLNKAKEIKASEDGIAGAQHELHELSADQKHHSQELKTAKQNGNAQLADAHRLELKKIADKKAEVQSEIDAETDQLVKLGAEKESLRPQDVRDAESKLFKAKLERQKLQDEHDAFAAQDPDPAATAAEYAPKFAKADADIQSKQRDLEVAVAKTGWVPRDKETVDGFSKQLHEKQNDLLQFQQKTRDNNQTISDSISHLDPQTKTASIQLWTQMAQASSVLTGSTNMAAASSEQTAGYLQAESGLVNGQRDLARMAYERFDQIQQDRAGISRDALEKVSQVSSSINQLNTDIGRNV
jgi:hypothetical protein